MSRPYPLYKINRSWCQCKKVLLGVRGVGEGEREGGKLLVVMKKIANNGK